MSTPEVLKETLDIAAAGITFAVVAQWLPAIAALFTIAWTGIRIYEWIRTKRIAEE